MPITFLYGCAQIETVVGDLSAARDFMLEVLGGGEIEQQMAREITALFPAGAYVLEHFDVGEGLFQFNAPSPQARFGDNTPVHQAYLDRIGACVTNLNYYVDDAEHARDLLTGMGAPVLIEGPSNLIPSLADYGAANNREQTPPRKFYFLGSRDLIGFDLELMEPNFKRFTRQTAQYPCFVHPRPRVGDANLELMRLEVVAPDLEAVYAALTELIAPASRSNPYEARETAEEKAFRIGLGGLELEYRQPLAPGPLAEHLERYGPGVQNVVFGARDPGAVVARARAAGVEISSLVQTGEPAEVSRRHHLASRERVGFSVVLEPRRASALQFDRAASADD